MGAGKQACVTDSARVIRNSRAGASKTDFTAGAVGGDCKRTEVDVFDAKSLFRLSWGALDGLFIANCSGGDDVSPAKTPAVSDPGAGIFGGAKVTEPETQPSADAGADVCFVQTVSEKADVKAAGECGDSFHSEMPAGGEASVVRITAGDLTLAICSVPSLVAAETTTTRP